MIIRAVIFTGFGSHTVYIKRWVIPTLVLLLTDYSCFPRLTMYVKVVILNIDFSSWPYIHQVYGLPTLLSGNGFPNAQCTYFFELSLSFFFSFGQYWVLSLWQLKSALLNIIETLLNIAYVYLAHVTQWPAAPVIGFGSALMTLSKTVLYWAQEYYCGFCAVGHNNLWDLFFLYIIPNGCIAFLFPVVCTPWWHCFIDCGSSSPLSLYYNSGRISLSLLLSPHASPKRYLRVKVNEYSDI